MQVVANFEIKAECSVVSDDLQLEIKHPQGLYRALIKNIPRADYSRPFVLSLYLYFDTPSLDEAEDTAEERLADCLNMLALTAGSAFSRYRIRQIVDCTPESGMRDVLFWSDAIDHEDPQPFLDERISKSIERLSEFQLSPAIRRAMRWYRLGINETTPDDQFQCFWFALEIIAEAQKDDVRVPSNCSTCNGPLFCESCSTHPTHKPYKKQAIRALLISVDKECDDLMFKRLDKTRNGLMHGMTLEEIQKDRPEGETHIVDILGNLVFKALVSQFPRELCDGGITLGMPSTYIHHKLRGVVNIQTIVPADASGNLDLSFSGTTVELMSDGPPQSESPSVLVMTDEQYDRLAKLSHKEGEHQAMCRRIARKIRGKKDGRTACIILATDLSYIRKAINGSDAGEWQDLFREIFKGNSV